MALILSGIGAIFLFFVPSSASAQDDITILPGELPAEETISDSIPSVNFIDELTGEPADTTMGRVRIFQDERMLERIGIPGKTTPENIVMVDGIPCLVMTGYRIQAFAGNNQATAKQDAFQREIKLKSFMPGLPTYVRYSAPFWRLRVGDFLTYEEAYEVLLKFQKAFDYGREMSIVREKINVPLETVLR